MPIPWPTFAPTIACHPGQYLNAHSNLCTSCSAGKFTDASQPPWPSACTLCKSGTYTSQTTSTICNDCPVGKFSSEDRTGCITCSAGQYTFNKTSCVDCESGRYAPRALTGSCLLCGAGSHTNTSGCATCQAGRFSLAETQLCELCAEGKSSAAASKACTSCAAGYYSPSKGSAHCIACAAGSYSSTSASVNCTSCPPGKAQGATGQSSCVTCSAGTFSETYGEATCSSCSGISFSFEEAASCTRCSKKYYYFDSSCIHCPEGTKCGEDGMSTLNDLLILPGWWRISKETGVVRQCMHGSVACRGGLNFSDSYCAVGDQGILAFFAQYVFMVITLTPRSPSANRATICQT